MFSTYFSLCNLPTEFNFSTLSKRKGISGGRYWECNLAAIWGQMFTGGGHAPLAESMALLGTFAYKEGIYHHRKHIGQWW